MNPYGISGQNLAVMLRRFQPRRGFLFGMLIVGALIAFEIFNYSTTDFALADLLGDLRFVGIRWATILAIAFCGIDFAGIARLFTPEEGANEPNEVWYLFGAWMLAATMNAMLTWWGVSLAVLNHETLGNAVVARETLLRVVPIFVAILVWLIRVLIIGTFSVAGDRLFTQGQQPVVGERVAARTLSQSRQQVTAAPPITRPKPHGSTVPSPAASTAFRAAAKAAGSSNGNGSGFSHARPNGSSRTRPTPVEDDEEYPRNNEPGYNRSEPTYHPVAMDAPRRDNNSQVRR